MATSKKTTPKKVTKKSEKKSVTQPESLGTCFVMMPFREPFDLYYKTIFRPAISKANLDPVRTDDLFRPGGIVSDLWQMIQDAKILLAELTTKNANVFYELGLAHAIGKPIILVSETMDDVPFDLQQLRVLQYNKNDPKWGDKLSDAITKAITETIANPIEAVPSIFRKTVPSQAPEQDATAARLDNIESEIRTLRTGKSTSSENLDSWDRELNDVRNYRGLYLWFNKWYSMGVPVATLLDATKGSLDIPRDWVKKLIREIADP